MKGEVLFETFWAGQGFGYRRSSTKILAFFADPPPLLSSVDNHWLFLLSASEDPCKDLRAEENPVTSLASRLSHLRCL